MDSTHRAALAIDRGVRVRAAERSTPIPGGVAIWHDGLPTINFLNAVLLDAPLPAGVGARELAELAERCHARAHDRYLVLDDADAAERLSPDLLQAGWERRRIAAQTALRAGTRSLCFAAGEDGLQSTSTLFLDEDGDGPIAMVEEVATLSEFRSRGLARAVVSAAVHAALRSGASRIVIPTDAEDWPQLLYAKLGFEPVASSVSFTLRGGSR